MDIYKEFDDYVSNYDMTDKDIKLKYNHSYRVMKLSEKYAKKLNFSEYDVKLATVIGLLHDIGRFEQLKLYHTYRDDLSIDHAEYGVKVLFEDGLISKFWSNEDDYELIKFAIKNHNKFEIEETLDERVLMHAKLIRDTDKLDILYLMGVLNEIDLTTTDDEISDSVIESIKNHESVLKKDRKNKNDDIALYFSFAFDINYDECLTELKENFINLYKAINDDRFEEIYKCAIKYIDERNDKNVR